MVIIPSQKHPMVAVDMYQVNRYPLDSEVCFVNTVHKMGSVIHPFTEQPCPGLSMIPIFLFVSPNHFVDNLCLLMSLKLCLYHQSS